MISENVLFANATNVFYQLTRLQTVRAPWQWALMIVASVVLLVFIVMMYRRDSHELRRGIANTLLLLRLVAFAGIMAFFLNLEKLSERQLVKTSRVLMAVDTSQSMALPDSTSAQTGLSRIGEVVSNLENSDLLERLRQKHDVVVYKFGEGAKPTEIASFSKVETTTKEEVNEALLKRRKAEIVDARFLLMIAAGIVGGGVFCWLIFLLFGIWSSSGNTSSYWLLLGTTAVFAGLIVGVVAVLKTADLPLEIVAGFEEPADEDLMADPEIDDPALEKVDPVSEASVADIDWNNELIPRGAATRIGDNLRFLINKERGGPVAGIVLLSDGGNNQGAGDQDIVNAANDASMKIYTVGLGSLEERKNVRVVDMEAPARVYPGDKFQITGFVQAYGLEGEQVVVTLVSSPEAAKEGEENEVIEEQVTLRLIEDGHMLPHAFTVEPEGEGKRIYKVRAKLVQNHERVDTNKRDDFKSAAVEIVDRRTRVLLVAGGPTREYRFLRNLLYRDKDVTLDVFLQSGEEGISQESDNLLFDFPIEQDELYEYDCVVAIDVDWLALNKNQIELLEKWVGEKSGGLVTIAGPVFTPEWSIFGRRDDDRVTMMMDLYPVVFHRQGGVGMARMRFGSETASPLQLTSDGKRAEFLWLEDDALESEKIWAAFEGVYGFFQAKDTKPGAKVYAEFRDPDAKVHNEFPIYLAGHFYGSGRVFYQASGEMWRIQEIDEVYFQRYYTKLIRWASQGRLLQDSTRGVLLVDKERCLVGDHIAVQAILQDAQHQPLKVAAVAAELIAPDGVRKPLQLRQVKDGAREGSYAWQFTALLEGDYRVEVQPPDSAADELLTREVRTRVPQLEIEDPKRNDAFLEMLATRTTGKSFIGCEQALNTNGDQEEDLPASIQAHDQTDYLPGVRDSDFEERLMGCLMSIICGALCMEWLVRRLSKLA